MVSNGVLILRVSEGGPLGTPEDFGQFDFERVGDAKHRVESRIAQITLGQTDHGLRQARSFGQPDH